MQSWRWNLVASCWRSFLWVNRWVWKWCWGSWRSVCMEHAQFRSTCMYV